MVTARPPIREDVKGLRQRARAGGWRVWWEPNAAERGAGLKPVDLDADRPTWSVREARRLNVAAEAAVKGKGRGTGGRTMAALIADYQRGRAFRGLKPKTQTGYRGLMRLIEEKWGAEPVAGFTKPVMRRWYETLADTRGEYQAKQLIRAASILFQHAETMLGWRPENSNPCYRLRVVTPKGRARFASWEEIAAMQAAADRVGLRCVAVALRLSLFTGQRETDVLAATPDAFAPGGPDLPPGLWVWRLTRSKRGNADTLPVHPAILPDILAARTAGASHLVLDDVTGQPLGDVAFGYRWAKVRTEAAKLCPSVASLQFRDLRRTFGVLARRAGVGIDDAADVLGNSAATDPVLAETYMPGQLDTRMRAVMAINPPAERKLA